MLIPSIGGNLQDSYTGIRGLVGAFHLAAQGGERA